MEKRFIHITSYKRIHPRLSLAAVDGVFCFKNNKNRGDTVKTYTLIGGVNGAGKSSLTGSLRSERSDLGIVVDPDKLTVQCGGDEYEGD